jgi:hypothetical protein
MKSPIDRCWLLLLLWATCSACGSSSEKSSDSGASAGICSANGWRDTCHWLSTCSGGRFELVCNTNDDAFEGLIADAGVTLDGSVCACVRDEATVQEVPYDDSFCSSQFGSGDPNRIDQARARVEAICDWRL